ncbi:uncharacterized protein [Branchiostoma lanceolatum]|uniref:uncharacterized protein n=1 Tax=Branchiostoma lanceolatum TaxID=7740 RepID=UPI003451AC92
MKIFVVAAVVTLLASAWAVDPPNLEVKEVSNKCVWTWITAMPDAKIGGCPVTFPDKGKLEKFAAYIKETTDKAKTMAADAKLSSSPLTNRVTQALIERTQMEQDVTEMQAAIKNIESSNTLLLGRASKVGGQIAGLNRQILAVQTMVDKL